MLINVRNLGPRLNKEEGFIWKEKKQWRDEQFEMIIGVNTYTPREYIVDGILSVRTNIELYVEVACSLPLQAYTTSILWVTFSSENRRHYGTRKINRINASSHEASERGLWADSDVTRTFAVMAETQSLPPLSTNAADPQRRGKHLARI